MTAVDPPRKILAVMDESATQTSLLSAAALADRYGAALEVFSCVEPPRDLGMIARLSGQTPQKLMETLCVQKNEQVAKLLAAHLPDHEIQPHLAVGKTFIEIIRHAIAIGADFVVKKAEPLSGVHRLFFASTDQHLLRKCPCPVWLQPDNSASEPKRIIAAVDIDIAEAVEPDTLMSLNRRVIEAARCIAAPAGAQIFALHAWDAIGEGLVRTFSSGYDASLSADSYTNQILAQRQRAMAHLMADIEETRSNAGAPTLIPHLIRGAPEQVIEEQCRHLGADIVVMGTVARTGISGVFIGNTAENIINNIECPILAVKPDGFVSPLAQSA